MEEYHFNCMTLCEINNLYIEKYDKNDIIFDLLCFVIKKSIKHINSNGNEYRLTQLSLLDGSLNDNESVRIFYF